MNPLVKSVAALLQRQSASVINPSILQGEGTRTFSSIGALPGHHESKSCLFDAPIANMESRRTLFGNTYEMNDNGYTVKLNLKKFKPENINVKTKSNKIIVQSALHNDNPNPQSEFERMARLFLRVYHIPGDGDMKKTTADLTSDGILLVQVPKAKVEPEIEDERCVPIKYLQVSMKAKELFEQKK